MPIKISFPDRSEPFIQLFLEYFQLFSTIFLYLCICFSNGESIDSLHVSENAAEVCEMLKGEKHAAQQVSFL
jgi:hypothetical protein